MGVLLLLGRRADAHSQFVQLDVPLFQAPQDSSFHPPTCRHRSTRLELRRCFVERSCDGWRP